MFNKCYSNHDVTRSSFPSQKEIEELRYNLATISSTTDDSAQKLKADYLQKLNILEAQVISHFNLLCPDFVSI